MASRKKRNKNMKYGASKRKKSEKRQKLRGKKLGSVKSTFREALSSFFTNNPEVAQDICNVRGVDRFTLEKLGMHEWAYETETKILEDKEANRDQRWAETIQTIREEMVHAPDGCTIVHRALWNRLEFLSKPRRQGTKELDPIIKALPLGIDAVLLRDQFNKLLSLDFIDIHDFYIWHAQSGPRGELKFMMISDQGRLRL